MFTIEYQKNNISRPIKNPVIKKKYTKVVNGQENIN
jgi:hypothetical protein